MVQVDSVAVASRGVYDRPWRNIAAAIHADIKAGVLRPGDRLPTTAELALRYPDKARVRSKNTIRSALDQLIDDSLIEMRGRSFYVREDIDVTPAASTPEPEPVVAAIVTSHLGVLMTRRVAGDPPVGFVTGKIEPGESQVDAAIREVKEETGLEVHAGHQEIGRRVHPKTKRTMVYLACLPVGGTDVFIGDPEELSAVFWVPTLGELFKLVPREHIFPPVLEHLGRMIP